MQTAPPTILVDSDSDISYLNRVAARRKNPEQARAALLAAGERLLALDGFDAVNSNQIARQAGVGIGTFYRHFEDKAALANALMLQAWEELGASMPGPEIQDPLQVAAAATRGVVEYAARYPDRFRVAFGSSRRSNVALSVRPIERSLRQHTERDGALVQLEPRIAARAWWAMISSTIVWWLEERERLPEPVLIATLTLLHPLAAARVPGAPENSK